MVDAHDQRRVLVVEDDVAIQMLLQDALGDEGYEVRVAGNGVSALERLEEWTPDAILLDLTLPEMDGATFILKQRDLGPPASTVPTVLVTGTHQHEHLVEELGAAALLRKPFDLDELLRLVEKLTRCNDWSGSPAPPG